MWKCRQDVADVVVVVVVEEVEVAEDLPPHVIPGMIYMSHNLSKILKVSCFETCFMHQFDILIYSYKSFITCLI